MNQVSKKHGVTATMNGFICGGCVSQSTFESAPWAYMMCFVMPDDKFAEYFDEKDEKKSKALFKKFARSMI